MGDVSYLIEQINNIIRLNLPTSQDFILLSLNESLFPKNLDECRNLIEAYQLDEAESFSIDKFSLTDRDLILAPFPVNARLVNSEKNLLEYKDEMNDTDSSFRKYGICVFRRHKGMVVESSLRKL